MMSVWAPSSDIVCVHPGSAALQGYEAVNHGWTHIFAGGPIQIESTLQHQTQTGKMAWHGVVERLTPAEGNKVTTLFVSHLYVKSKAGWRLQVHHAGPSMPAKPGSVVLH
jgi:ketosteroid isomerase-like protein